MATRKTFSAKVRTNFFLNMEASIINKYSCILLHSIQDTWQVLVGTIDHQMVLD